MLTNFRQERQFNNEKGQVLLLTILVTVIVLTLAVAASRRTTVDIRQLNAATESNRALTAAEAGVEDVLLALKNGELPVDCGILATPACTLIFGDSEVTAVDVTTQNSLSLSDVPEEQTVEVKLYDPSDPINGDFDGNLDITWEEGSAIAITIIFSDLGDPAVYSLYREVLSCGDFAPGNGFTVVNDGDGDGFCNVNNINIGSLESTYGATAISVRIRPMYANTSISVTGYGGSTLPTQAFSVVSTGSAGDSERTIQATRTNEAMSAIFDFVLFNGSLNTPIVSSDGTSWFQFENGDIHSMSALGIDVNVPPGAFLCIGTGGCVFTSAGVINTYDGGVSGEGWQQSNYEGEFPIERYTYDSFWQALSDEVDAEGTTLSSVQGVLSSGGIVRVTGFSGNTLTINQTEFDLLSTNPTVVFVGGDENDPTDVNLNIDIAEFKNKNVVFIVSGDVILTPAVNVFEAATIFDGLFTVRDYES